MLYKIVGMCGCQGNPPYCCTLQLRHIFQLEEDASGAMCQNNLTLARTIDLHVIMLHVCTLKLGHLPFAPSKYISHSYDQKTKLLYS